MATYFDGQEQGAGGTPSAHAPTHEGGADPVSAAGIGADAAGSAAGAVGAHDVLAGAHGGAITKANSAEQTANKGAVSGYAPLDASQQVPSANAPAKAVYSTGGDQELAAGDIGAADAGDLAATAACARTLVLSRSTSSEINTVVGGVQIDKSLFPSIDVKLRAQGDISGTAAGVLELYDLTNAAIIVSLALPNGVFNALSGVLTLAGALTQYELRLRRNGPDPADVVTVTWAGLQAA
mgnify:CR=1 FL=1